MGEVCPNVGVSRRSEEFFINGGGVLVVCSVSGRNRRFRRFYWDEYAILEKFPELLEIKISIASVGDFSSSRESTIYSCITPDGRVFYSQSLIDEFVIHGCEADGTPFLRIEDESVHRVRKSEDELQVEIENFNSFFSRMTGGSTRDNFIHVHYTNIDFVYSIRILMTKE